MPCAPCLGYQGEHRVRNKSPLAEMLCKLFANLYSPENPEGVVSLGVAENSLLSTELIQYYEKHLRLCPDDLMYGTSLKGSKRMYTVLKKLYDSARFNSVWDIEQDHLVLGSGVGALIDQITSLICDRGDAILLAKPFFAGFSKDIGARNGALCVGVDITAQDQASPETLEDFERKIQDFKAAGIATRAVLLCNPHNPMGFCYPRQTVVEYARFAERHNLFLIVDEIYALSVYDSDARNAQPFTSILSIDVAKEAGCSPERIIHLYGASKDFGINGFRVGAMVTQNPEILEGFTSAALWIKLASPSDALFSALLDDRQYLDWYLKTNSSRLSAAYRLATDFCSAHSIEYVAANAGHFVMIDLRRYLPKLDSQGRELKTEAEQEAALFLQLLHNRVYIAPGAFYKMRESGWFRLTFSVEAKTMQEGLRRLGEALHPASKAESNSGLKDEPLNMRAVATELSTVQVSCFSCLC